MLSSAQPSQTNRGPILMSQCSCRVLSISQEFKTGIFSRMKLPTCVFLLLNHNLVIFSSENSILSLEIAQFSDNIIPVILYLIPFPLVIINGFLFVSVNIIYSVQKTGICESYLAFMYVPYNFSQQVVGLFYVLDFPAVIPYIITRSSVAGHSEKIIAKT